MKTQLIILAVIVIYIFVGWRTKVICVNGRKYLDEIDKIIIPLVATFWPLFWGFTIGQEIIGFFRRIVRKILQRIRRKRKQLQHQERLKRMNQ